MAGIKAVVLLSVVTCAVAFGVSCESGDPVRPATPGDTVVVSGHDSLSIPVRDTTQAMQTDSLVYHLEMQPQFGMQTRIGFDYHNPLPDTMYIVNCRGDVLPYLEVQRDTTGKMAWSAIRLACLSPPVVIAPGATYHGSLTVFSAPQGSNTYPQFAPGEIEGTYRLLLGDVVNHYTDRGSSFGDPVDVKYRHSNSFLIKKP